MSKVSWTRFRHTWMCLLHPMPENGPTGMWASFLAGNQIANNRRATGGELGNPPWISTEKCASRQLSGAR